jgi:hypothetical protein
MENSLNREELLVLANEIRRRHEGYVDVSPDSGYNYLYEEVGRLYNILINDYDLDPSEKDFNFFTTRLREIKTDILRKKNNPTSITKRIYRNLPISKFKKTEKLQSILEKFVNLNLLIRMAEAYFEQEKEKPDLVHRDIGRLDSQQIQQMFNKYGISNIFIMYKLKMDTKKASLEAQMEAMDIHEMVKVVKVGDKNAQCPICYEDIKDLKTCRQCRKCRNKFHSRCNSDQEIEVSECPFCRHTETRPCYNTINAHGNNDTTKSLSTTQKVSGGRRCRSTQKRKKTIRKKRKNKKRTRRFR